MKHIAALTALALVLSPLAPAVSQPAASPVSTANVLSEITLLAGPGLRGRGSATPDEAIAAGYVASFFRDFGLKPAPGMDGFLQTAPVVRKTPSGAPTLTVDGVAVPGVTVLLTAGGQVGGTVATFADAKGDIPTADVLVFTGPASQFTQLRRAARGKAKLILIAESELSRRLYTQMGGKVSIRTTLEGAAPERSITLASLPADALAKIAPGAQVSLDVPVTVERGTTTNAIGYLSGTDPKAGVILLSAHLDHLGVRADGVVMPGANDDASGTVAVIELARAFAGKRMKRGMLFVAYGSEELGGLGSTWFGEHPPVPLDQIVANIEFEMIGAQDPKLPKGSLMMTGSERSNMFDLMKAQGAMIAADPYPEQSFFQRSDNYSLALKGIVAHTFSGWAVTPTYHSPTDTVENIDIAFMTAAIQSLIAPIRSLSSSDAKPVWKPNGQPN